MSAIILSEQYNDFFDSPTGLRQGAIGSALAAGSVAGSFIAGPISNRIGRRNSLMFACFWWLLGTAIQTGTNGFGSLIAGRIFNGVTVGITSSQVPVYLAEIARKEKRGQLVIIQQLAIGMYRLAWTKSKVLMSVRMGHLDHVLHWLRMHFHSGTSILPDGMGYPVRALCLPHDRAAFLA